MITSTANPRIKALGRLRKRRGRDDTGRLLIEGYRELARAVEAGVHLEEVYYCRSLFLGENEGPLLERARAAGAQLIELAEAPCRKVSYRDRPEGLLGVALQFPTRLDALSPGSDPLVLVVESVEKPGNLGTMLRTAEAAGAAAVVVCDPRTDPFNPNVVRASLGALFLVPLAVATTPEAVDWLRSRGIRSLAATPTSDLPHWQADLRGAVALVVGSEQLGLSEHWLDGADQRIGIPMPGRFDSLNAASAAAVLLFEAVRQRSSRDRSE